MKIWFLAKGSDILSGIVITVIVVVMLGGWSYAAVNLFRTGNPVLQTLAVMFVLGAFTGIQYMLRKD